MQIKQTLQQQRREQNSWQMKTRHDVSTCSVAADLTTTIFQGLLTGLAR
jgi:hypothetical protein